VFVGWTGLVEMAPPAGAAIQVRDAGAFGQFWRAPSESRDFAPPLAGNRFRDHARIDPPALDEAVSARLAEAGADARAGCLAGLLPEAPTTLVERWLALSARPRLPRGFGQPPPGKELRFDLARGATLNRTLNSSEVPSGARVVLFGAMRKQLIEPVILRNKTLRIEFEEGDEPLQLEPTARSGDERPSALFRGEGGHLDLVGARIRVPSSATRNYPLRILEVVDGSFSVQNCVLQGQIRDGAEDVPVIEWTRSGAAKPERDYGLIVDSFIGARHRVIGGDLSGRLLEVHNSVLAGLGNGFDVALGTSGEGHVLLRSCTLSGVESIVRVRTPGGDGSARLNFFVKNTVFAPPVESLPGGPAVMTHPQGADQDGRIVWWEEGTAYAQQVQRYRVLDGSKAAGAQDFDAVWVRPWGPDHVLHALTGPKAVLLASNLPSPDRLEAASFRLSEACGAYRWGEGGTPVGAHVEEVGPTKPDAKPQAQSPRATRPAGKSQPGF
jgi:hypothetical protein